MIDPFKVIPYSNTLYLSWFHNFKSITIGLKGNSVRVIFPSKVYSEFLTLKWVQFESIVVRPSRDIMYCILEHWSTKLGDNFRDLFRIEERALLDVRSLIIAAKRAMGQPGFPVEFQPGLVRNSRSNQISALHVDICFVKSPPPSW